MGQTRTAIRRADSRSTNVQDAIKELDASLHLQNSALTLFFCANSYCQPDFASAIRDAAGDALVVGCTSAGEIGAAGYARKSIAAMSFPKEDFKAGAALVEGLKDFTSDQAEQLVRDLRQELKQQGVENMHSCFALLLVDGMSIAEESLTYRLQEALGEIPLIGGSAGDDYHFERTNVYLDGRFSSDAAVLVVIHTERPWEVFKEQHFRPTDKKMVVTAADPERRVVLELNGEVAGKEYARLLGLDDPALLTPLHYGRNPLMLRMGDNWYVRSPHKVLEDGSLGLFCAIDVGLVLVLGQGVNLVSDLKARLADIQSRIGPIAATIACDCIQRRMELELTGELDQASEILTANNAIGFSTYGEQFGVLHVNQTLTGVAIG